MRKILLASAFAAAIVAAPIAVSEGPFGAPKLIGQSSALTLDKARGVLTMSPLLERVTPAVVSIKTQGKAATPKIGNKDAEEFFERFFGQPMPNQPDRRNSGSIGSGVIVDAAKGLILTNHHVVENADEILVTLKDKREVVAELVGGDKKTDIAVLKVVASNLRDIDMAPSGSTRTGDYVIAIGNPFGFEHTVTSGIVSATGRYVQGGDRLQDMIQTDASINPGNSGGALINSKGELIGINTMIISRSGGNNGIGFAVPVKIAKNVMNQLVSYGEVRRGRIGVTIRDIDPALQEAMGLSTLNGALVNDVSDDSPAAKAGLESGDIIIGFNGEDIMNSNDIRNAVGLVEPGARADLTYLRDGRRRTTRITVEASEDDTQTPVKDAIDSVSSESFSGAELTGIPEGIEPRGGSEGVYVASVSPGSKAARAGLKRGDIIRKIAGRKVSDLNDFEKAIEGKSGPFAVSVERNGTNLFLAVR